MCINPNSIWVLNGPKWEQQPVGCRQCWRCKKNRVNDYVGRCLAESATSVATCAITLTYAPRDDLADKVLHPRHFQLFMKLLRRAGHKIRYLVAGEYGDEKGRAHFHAILFFSELQPSEDGKAPFYNWDHLSDPSTSPRFSDLIPSMQNLHIREWPHGHVYADWSASEKAVRYVCKYLLKEDKNNAWFSLSKKPAIGYQWFQEKAAMARELGVLPSRFDYLPPGASKDRPYLMTGATRRDYLNSITTDPALRHRMSEWVAKTFDKHHRQRVLDELNSQPLDILQAAFDERRDREESQIALIKLLRELDEKDAVTDMLQASERHRLRRHEMQWIPEEDKPHVSPL